MRLYLARLSHTFALLALLAIILGQLGAWHWFAELFSHFLPVYALAFLLAALLTRTRRRGLWTGCTLASLIWMLQPFSLWQSAPFTASQRLIWYNVHLDNPAAAQESAQLLAHDADILMLAEINLAAPGWQPLRDAYAHGCEHRQHSPFALAVWAKTALRHCRVDFIADYPYIRAELADGTALYALHPPPPIHPQLARARRVYLHSVAQRIAQEPRVLVAGDFNLTPYSPLYRQFVRDSRLRAATLHYLPTWKPLYLNIDLAFARDLALRVDALPWQYSDHRPLLLHWRAP